jgi:pimeloyl-ACP methyl ester carboxylesterase
LCAHRITVRQALGAGLLVTLVALTLSACGSDGGGGEAAGAEGKLDRVVEIEEGRGLYVRCTGAGSPTVVMEAGDEGDSSQYAFAEQAVAKKTRTCVYDRANLGRSDPAPGPRRLPDLVGDLENLLDSAEIPGPYVLVGTSGGGFIVAGYAEEHPDRVAGMVLVDTPPASGTYVDPPRELVEILDPDNPKNVEHRDCIRVERDAWEARRRIGDVPMRVITADYPEEIVKQEYFTELHPSMRRNVELQMGWLDASPQAKQIVVHTGHAVQEEKPEVVIEAILDVVREARSKQG